MPNYPEDFQSLPLEKRNEFFADEARKYRAEKAKGQAKWFLPVDAPLAPSAETLPTSVRLKRASEIKATPISWVWPEWLARGKMHILGGQPGSGKTTLVMKIAATAARLRMLGLESGRAAP